MNGQWEWTSEVTEAVADTLIEKLVEEEFQKRLRGEPCCVPDFVVINGEPHRVADHL